MKEYGSYHILHTLGCNPHLWFTVSHLPGIIVFQHLIWNGLFQLSDPLSGKVKIKCQNTTFTYIFLTMMYSR